MEGGYIGFGAGPASAPVPVASFLDVLFLTSGWILTKLA